MHIKWGSTIYVVYFRRRKKLHSLIYKKRVHKCIPWEEIPKHGFLTHQGCFHKKENFNKTVLKLVEYLINRFMMWPNECIHG